MDTFTLIHVLISLAAILSGFVVVGGMLTAKTCPRWTGFFLATTVATSVTGFFFPFHGFTPALGFGVISLVVLALAIVALYIKKSAGSWRRIYTVTAGFALYLNFFVLVVQSFQKIPLLKSLAPTQSEPPFVIAQAITLVVFVTLGILTTKRFHVAPAVTA